MNTRLYSALQARDGVHVRWADPTGRTVAATDAEPTRLAVRIRGLTVFLLVSAPPSQSVRLAISQSWPPARSAAADHDDVKTIWLYSLSVTKRLATCLRGIAAWSGRDHPLDLDLSLSASPDYEQIVRSIEHEQASRIDDHGFDAESVGTLIIGLLTKHFDKADEERARRRINSLPNWRLRRVVEYVDAHIDNPIGLADLARAAGLTSMYFAAQFRATVGIRPHDFILLRRIERAQTLLLAADRTLIDVALTVGFKTQAHFTTTFKRFVGETPHRWRSRRRETPDLDDADELKPGKVR